MNLEVSFCVSCKVASGISYKLYIYIQLYTHNPIGKHYHDGLGDSSFTRQEIGWMKVLVGSSDS